MDPDQPIRETPSLTQGRITQVRPGVSLGYSDLTGREKRDYLFEQGIRTTAYGQGNNGARPDVVSGIVQFSGSALQSIANHLLSQSLTRVDDELEEPKRKLFHTYGTVAEIVFSPAPDTPYSGLFRQQASGLARFSYAGPVSGVGVVPGLGLKFPRDGPHPSVDLVLNNIVPGTPIYDVLGLDEDVELELARQGTTRLEDLISRGRKIGVIQTESAFLASRYGDYRLFFKHDHRFMRDEFKPANL